MVFIVESCGYVDMWAKKQSAYKLKHFYYMKFYRVIPQLSTDPVELSPVIHKLIHKFIHENWSSRSIKVIAIPFRGEESWASRGLPCRQPGYPHTHYSFLGLDQDRGERYDSTIIDRVGRVSKKEQ